MKKCIFDGIEVSERLIGSNSTSFGKKLNREVAIPFSIEIDADDAVASFSTYYLDFVERESEDEGFEEPLDGYFLRLKETGYLSFERMVFEQPELLGRVIQSELPAEFLGYVFLDKGASVESKKYILQELANVEIENGKIICTGSAFLNPRYADL